MSNRIRRSNKRLQHKHRNNNNNDLLLPHKHGNIHGDGDGFQQQVRRCKGRGLRNHDYNNNNNNNYNNNNLLLRLPEELFADEILVRLPAKQLARMRCVSKPLYALLSQPRFIKAHLDRNLFRNNNKDNEILLVVNPGCVFTKEKVRVTAHPSRSPDIPLNDFIKLPPDFPISSSVSEWGVIGSVHGLICFKCGFNHQWFDIYLWNPSLSAVMCLPEFTIPSRPHEDLSIDIQFGFDPKSDDYKVVKLMTRCVPDMQVEVYSMRKGTWQFISESFPSKFHRISSGTQAIAGGHDGHVYWLCRTKNRDNSVIAFDLGNETFYEISLPDSICISKGRDKILCFFDGKLCVTSYRRGISFEFEMWVMNEPESWVKHSVLSRFTCNIAPMGFTLNNEFLFSASPHDSLALYDPDTTKVKYLCACILGSKFDRSVFIIDGPSKTFL